MVNIRQIPFYRDNKVNKFLPRFLTKEDDPLLTKMILKFQESLFNEENVLSKEKFFEEVDDYKLGLCIFEALQSEFYPYSYIIPEKLEELVKYRLDFWRFINEEFGGAVLDAISRESALIRFQKLLPKKYTDMSTIQINDMLFQDYSFKRKRIRPSNPPDTLEVRNSVNTRILKTLIRNSQKVIIRVPKVTDLNSNQIKKLFFLSKRFGVFSTVIKTDKGDLEIKITGPEELIGRREKYGGKILAIFCMLIQQKNFKLEITKWELIIEIPWGNKNRIINLDFSSFHDFFIDYEEIEKSMDFDSRTEEAFYRVLASLYPWEVSREPLVLVENNQIFIPDFSIRFAEFPPIYIEIIGFWTEDYKVKKINKLTELSKGVFPLKLILIVDKSLNFPSISPFVKFDYESNDFNSVLSPLNRYLKTNFLIPYEKQRLKELKSDLSTIIGYLFGKKDEEGIISETSLLKYLKLYAKDSLRSLFSDEKFKIYLRRNGWNFIARIGLIKRFLLNKWRKSLFKKFSAPKKYSLNMKDLSPIFPKYLPEGTIPILLEHFGFKIQFLQLENIIVHLPKKKSKREKI